MSHPADWDDVLPPWLAVQQRAWERGRTVHRMREVLGLTYREIGELLVNKVYRYRQGVGAARCQQIHQRYLRYPRSPLEADLALKPFGRYDHADQRPDTRWR